MNSESGLQIDLVGALKRRAFLACSIAGAVTLVMYWIAMALPNQYTSSAVLLVEPQSVSEKLVEAGAARVDLNERLHLMTSEILSRSRLSRIIDDLGIYEAESKKMTRQEVVNKMRNSISVKPVLPELTRGLAARGTAEVEINTFEVFFRASDPVVAAEVAQRLANDFIQEHIAARVKSTQTSLEFITAEVERLTKDIVAVEANIAEIKEANERSLPESMPTSQRILERTMGEIRYAQRALDVGRSDVSFWEHQAAMAAQQGQLDTDGRGDSPARRMQTLELLLAEQSSRGFTDRHPDVIATKQEIAELRAAVLDGVPPSQASGDGEPEEQVVMGFAQQNAEAEKLRAQARVGSMEQEVLRLQETREILEADLAGTARVAEQLDTLERSRKQLAESVRSFSSLHMDAVVQADMERRQLGERFRLLESAIPPLGVSSPNRRMILTLGLLLGLAVGIGAGVVAEGTDPSYHQQRDLQASVGIPVLAVIPSILFDADLAVRRRRRRLRIAAAIVVTGFFLSGGVANYIFVNGAPSWLRNILDRDPTGDGVEQEEARRVEPSEFLG